MSTGQFSIVIISKNEAKVIGETLRACKELTDDILLVDSFSTDDTVEIAKSYGARVISKEWLGYSATKNFGNQKAKYDWILSLDADEVLDANLVEAIQQITLQKGYVYYLNRLNYYCGIPVKHSGWFPQWIPRIFHREEHQWDNSLVHEKLLDLSKSNAIKLPGLMLHYSYFSEAQHLEKLDKYAKYRAEEWIERGKKPNLLKRVFGPGVRFFRNYFWMRGFLDGQVGYKIAKNEAKMVSLQFIWYDKLAAK